jgi:hypothetical protein
VPVGLKEKVLFYTKTCQRKENQVVIKRNNLAKKPYEVFKTW